MNEIALQKFRQIFQILARESAGHFWLTRLRQRHVVNECFLERRIRQAKPERRASNSANRRQAKFF